MKRRVIGIAATALLSACGAREKLAAPADAAPAPTGYGATAAPTPDDLLKPPIQTRPGRSDNLIESSDKRRSDEFDLPPPN